MKDKAYGKINLSLDIINRREDGYHNLKSVMLPIEFYDDISLNKNDADEFTCNRSYLRFDEHNTINKALNYMRKTYDIKDNFKIHLNKHIPTQAGLAGGSSDGASIIKMLDKLYKLNMSEEEIKQACLAVGSDVLFNYYSKPALIEGTGDKISFIDVKDDYYVLLVKPKRGVSTKEAYQTLNLNTCAHPPVDELVMALKEGRDINELIGNSLEESALRLCKDISKVKQAMLKAHCQFALMSGSGSTVFYLSKDKKEIESIYQNLQNQSFFLRMTKVLKD